MEIGFDMIIGELKQVLNSKSSEGASDQSILHVSLALQCPYSEYQLASKG